ncbi:Mis12 protein-domain-containing protein [Xylariaceae sp. FL1272]|nr:Mis12 protein-domain-containing protein [Xylariaceae sp. FL1272]
MSSANSDTELLTEHFGYPPVVRIIFPYPYLCNLLARASNYSNEQPTNASQSLIDDIINSVNILAERALNSVETGLLNVSPATLGFKPPKTSSKSTPQEKEEAKELAAQRCKTEVEAGTHQLETLLCASIDRNFDKFEIYVLRNILTVRTELRDWIRLRHYEGLDFSHTSTKKDGTSDPSSDGATSGRPTIESNTKLRNRLRESMKLNALLTAEKKKNDVLLGDLRRLVGDPNSTYIKTESQTTDGGDGVAQKDEGKSPFAFLHDKADLASSGGGAAPLSTTAAFTLSQMEALRSLSSSLRTISSDLKALPKSSKMNADGEEDESEDGEDDKNGRKSWRRERVEYVEGATRRHLEHVQGLELGRLGGVRDGEWQGGRSFDRGSVGVLEGVVGALSESGEKGREKGGDGGGVGGDEMEE